MSNESLEGEGKLMAVIGDEVSARIGYVHLTSLLLFFLLLLQDTCVGFVLGGIGEVNEHREANFMVVEKGSSCSSLMHFNSISFTSSCRHFCLRNPGSLQALLGTR